MGDRLGIGHAVTFETGGEDEQIGFRVKRREALRRYRAGRLDPVANPTARNVGIEMRGGLAVAGAVARYRQPPWQVAERRQRRDQHVKTLARHHGADRQQPHGAVLAAAMIALRQRRRIVARPGDGNTLGWHAVIGSDQFRRGRAGDDNALHRSERGPLAAAQRIGLRRRQSPFQRQRMMHQRQQRIPAGKLPRGFRQDPERQAVDDDGAAGGHGRQ